MLRIPTRNGMWNVQADGDAYVANAPLSVFRVTPHVPVVLHSFPAPPLRVRGTGHTETNLMNKPGQLRHGILTANSGLYSTEFVATPNWYEGFHYLQQWPNSWSDTRDGLLLSAGYLPEFGNNDQITLADDGFLMVYDVKHVATGKATYMSINVYSGLVGKLSIGSVYHDRFSDTATPYLPARSCGEFDVRL